MSNITLEIPRVPASPNVFLSRHWRFRHKNTRTWQIEVCSALLNAGYYGPREPFAKSQVIIDRRSKRDLDPDNLVGCMKPVIDALRKAGVILDDTPAHIELKVTQSRGSPLTRIHVTALST